MKPRRRLRRKEEAAAPSSIWHEWMVGVELAFLRLSPLFWGYGVPRGDGSAVVLVPGFLGSDLYLSHIGSWLDRIGYQSFYSGIKLNADCPNLLIRRYLNESIEQACKSSRGKIHLIGHSLGGTIALSAAAQMPDRIASVITLGAPIRGLEAHASIQHAADLVRKQILQRHGRAVLPTCYTARCTCAFVESLQIELPKSVRQTAVYTKTDGILNWKVCRTGDPKVDVEVSSTHIGMVFSPLVYGIVAKRLAEN